MKTIDIADLRRQLSYDPVTGLISWRIKKGRRKPGDIAGSQCANGYIDIKIDGQHYMAHRIAWALHKGKWPADEIDHRSRKRNDNRLKNLREATKGQNKAYSLRNPKSGFRGVKRDLRYTSSYTASIRKEGKQVHLGTFRTAKEASDAYQAEAEIVHGEFASHNQNLPSAATR